MWLNLRIESQAASPDEPLTFPCTQGGSPGFVARSAEQVGLLMLHVWMTQPEELVRSRAPYTHTPFLVVVG